MSTAMTEEEEVAWVQKMIEAGADAETIAMGPQEEISERDAAIAMIKGWFGPRVRQGRITGDQVIVDDPPAPLRRARRT